MPGDDPLLPCMMPRSTHARRWMLLSFLLVAFLPGCGPGWAPVEQRSTARGSYHLTPDGHYRVRRGDTLHGIAFTFGLDWRDLAGWNGIASPYTIYPDQELRLSPPPKRSGGVVTRGAPPPATSVSRSAEVAASGAPSSSASSKSPAAQSRSAAPATVPKQAAPAPGKWQWPTAGHVVSSFKSNDPSRNGIDIGGREGQPVVAAAGGEVVYSGSGLIGYGELIIVKHSDRILSAYAHNRRRLVQEGHRVTAGQKLAEMGRNDRNKPILHFEVRVDGVPQDPLKYLPGR